MFYCCLLSTCRPSGAIRGWCIVRTPTNVLFKQALIIPIHASFFT